MFLKFFFIFGGSGRYQGQSVGRLSCFSLRPINRLSHLSGRPFFRPQLVMAAIFLMLSLTLAGSLLAAQDEAKTLRERATAFWEARVKGDWSTVYDYLSETERKGGTKDQYVEFTKEQGPFRYLSYKLGEVDVEGDSGWVKTAFSVTPMRFPGARPDQVDRWMVWEKRDGQWYPLTSKEEESVPKLPPRLRPVKEEKLVTARANEFWQAREKGDYPRIYQLCAPAFREKTSETTFLGKKAQNVYVGHRIEWAEVVGDHARVKVEVSFRPDDPHLTKIEPSKQTIFQQWVKVNDQWYLDIKGQD
jgi:hypothetical protein